MTRLLAQNAMSVVGQLIHGTQLIGKRRFDRIKEDFVFIVPHDFTRQKRPSENGHVGRLRVRHITCSW
jgi:hypothetical protein